MNHPALCPDDLATAWMIRRGRGSVHPNEAGMELMADLWAEALCKK
jgi:lysophospholipase L1-like esterase